MKSSKQKESTEMKCDKKTKLLVKSSENYSKLSSFVRKATTNSNKSVSKVQSVNIFTKSK